MTYLGVKYEIMCYLLLLVTVDDVKKCITPKCNNMTGIIAVNFCKKCYIDKKKKRNKLSRFIILEKTTENC